MADYDRMTVKTERIERRTIVGLMEERQAVLAQLYDDRWRVIRSGPFADQKSFPKVDASRFLFVAERETE